MAEVLNLSAAAAAVAAPTRGERFVMFQGPNGAACYIRPRDIVIVGALGPDATRLVGLINGEAVRIKDGPELRGLGIGE